MQVPIYTNILPLFYDSWMMRLLVLIFFLMNHSKKLAIILNLIVNSNSLKIILSTMLRINVHFLDILQNVWI